MLVMKLLPLPVDAYPQLLLAAGLFHMLVMEADLDDG
jgi:hypothetical protein